MQSGNIFSIGEQDANNLLEEDLWEDFNTDNGKTRSSNDGSKENILQTPKEFNSGSQLTGFIPWSFVKDCTPAMVNESPCKTSQRLDSKFRMRPSISDSRHVSTDPESSSNRRKSYLANLENQSNKQFGVIQAKATCFQIASSTSTAVLPLSVRNIHTKTQPFKRKVISSSMVAVEELSESQTNKGNDTATACKVFKATAPEIDSRNTSPSQDGTSPIIQNVNDCPTSSFKSSAASLVPEQKNQTLTNSHTATSCEQELIKNVNTNPDKAHLPVDKLPSQRKTLKNGDNNVSANIPPPISQFQKKRTSRGHTACIANATSIRRASSFTPQLKSSSNSPSQLSSCQARTPLGGIRCTTSPVSTNKPTWNYITPGNSVPDNSSVRHKPVSYTPEQFSSPQLPVFTPRVAQLCKTPTGPRMGRQIRSSRKFPGPAGILPKLSTGQELASIKLSPLKEEKEEAQTGDGKSSQDFGMDDFNQGAWVTMKAEVGLEGKKPKLFLSQHNIASVLKKASMKQLHRNKVPHICVMIKLITFHVHDAVVTFKDPTGEMQGTLHRQLMEEYSSNLKPGCVLLLKQVGVLSPSLRNHYLNVTCQNVIQIFPAEHILSQESSTKSITVSECSENDACFGSNHLGKSKLIGKRMYSNNGKKFLSGLMKNNEDPKRESNELYSEKSKTIYLTPSGKEPHHMKYVFPGNSGNRHEQPLDTTPLEDSVADFIEGFEDELFEDY